MKDVHYVLVNTIWFLMKITQLCVTYQLIVLTTVYHTRKKIVNCSVYNATAARDKLYQVVYMALSDKTKEVLLFNLFYGENTQYTNEKDLYEAVKNKGITHKEVKDFVQKQEVTQLFKRQKRVKH